MLRLLHPHCHSVGSVLGSAVFLGSAPGGAVFTCEGAVVRVPAAPGRLRSRLLAGAGLGRKVVQQPRLVAGPAPEHDALQRAAAWLHSLRTQLMVKKASVHSPCGTIHTMPCRGAV
jgi:hypothetical protein